MLFFSNFAPKIDLYVRFFVHIAVVAGSLSRAPAVRPEFFFTWGPREVLT